MEKTVVLNVVGLTQSLMRSDAPFLREFQDLGASRSIFPMIPALTCPVQSTYLTGLPVSAHGIVGNGWYDQTLQQHLFWHQSNRLVAGEKIWDSAKQKDSRFTCANLFWWFNMYSSCDISVTPRPIYSADGRKTPDLWTNPPSLRDELQAELGRFPLFQFWGPNASLPSSEWIRDAACIVEKRFNPTLTLIYLPHLDYDLQRFGPDSAEAKAALSKIDRVCRQLVAFYRERGAKIVVLSEYGIQGVQDVVHVNRVLRNAGYLEVREELGGEVLDCGRSKAFALCDHQIAHVYVQKEELLPRIKELLSGVSGIAEVLHKEEQRARGLDHLRSGDLLCLSNRRAWFSYYYWLDDRRAPDFARTVDIHKKPGYDPVELFLDPSKKALRLRVAWKLALRRIGFRSLLDVIGLDDSLVRGSHGVSPARPEEWPVFISSEKGVFEKEPGEFLGAGRVREILLNHLFSS